MALEKTLESPLDSKEIKPVNPKGSQAWIFIGRTDAGKDWVQEEKGVREDEMVGRHHWLNGHEFEQALGGSERKGSLACYSPWSHKETELRNWTTTCKISRDTALTDPWAVHQGTLLRKMALLAPPWASTANIVVNLGAKGLVLFPEWCGFSTSTQEETEWGRDARPFFYVDNCHI